MNQNVSCSKTIGIVFVVIALLLFYGGYQSSKCSGGYCDTAMMAVYVLPLIGIILLIVGLILLFKK
ncbi:MAG: hypothetical protein M1324_03230 [Patescibacteria group bacterium]|nr:hypothetical protein [Patescibacteria group bacterium]